MADVINLVITGTVFDTPKFFGIKESTLTVVYFTLACNRGSKRFDPKYMFNVTATLKRAEIKYISKGARLAIVGSFSNSTDDGIEKVVIRCKEIQPMPVDRS